MRINLSNINNAKNKIAAGLASSGVSANFLTVLGVFFAFLGGLFIYSYFFMLAAYAILLSGICDLLDGAVARVSGAGSKFGGILDSALDRYGDGFLLGGVFFFCVRQGNIFYAVLALVAILGAFSVSYIRARAECVFPSCRVGFWERGERIGCLVIGLLLNNLPMMIWILAVGTQWTAIERLRHAYQLACGKDAFESKSSSAKFGLDRQEISYFFKVSIVLGALAFLRPIF